jgi:hypothetical protein
MELLAAAGVERTAAVGDVLYRVGDHRYPFIAIIEGEASIQDADGHEIIRHRESGFLGEMNLLSGAVSVHRRTTRESQRFADQRRRCGCRGVTI